MANSTFEVTQTASNIEWQQTQNFSFIYNQNAKFTTFGMDDFFNNGSTASLTPNDVFELFTISVDLPQMTASEMDTVLGGQRRVNIRMQELFRFSVKFRDTTGHPLRKYFNSLWIATQTEFPDTIMGTVTIKDQRGNVAFTSTNITINSVSAVQYDNNSTQIAEFDVQFLSPTFSDDKITNFGSNKYGDKLFKNTTASATSTPLPDQEADTDVLDLF